MKNYFKKFVIMFVMSLVLTIGFSVSAFASDDGVIGIANLNNTTENSAKVGSILKDPEKGWKRYDDANNKIVYGSGWSSYNNGPNVYKGAYTHNNKTVGKALKFKFYGEKLRILTWTANDNSGADVKIDDKDYGNFSNCSNSYEGSYLFFEELNLPKGVHEVSLITIDKKYTVSKDNWFALDAIDIDSNGQLLPYDEYLTLDKSTLNLTKGDSGQLTATTTPAGAKVTWKSSDPSVATVDSTGKVTGIKEGQATITATTADGLTATCVVTITPNGTDPNPNPDPTDTDKIVNIAHAKGYNTNNAGGDVTIIFHGSADTTLSVVKTADVKEVWIGDNFTYTLVITNTGTKTAKAVVVNDPAPNHIDFNVSGVTTTQGSVDSSSTSKNIIVNVGDIPPAGTVTIKVPATVIL
ncbi:putative repeat protein (TIGR01451 family) [Clostridium saccharoperbutylacetonicum]|uniref:BIG2 domain-containing protein n=1 Tax=Clostridium saccharoperbutylacetonicum N1-4(HMT) TaxID=931276 RepID=M1MHA9_9CLOT|nr:Ig-like domain-containing protein [Clostridium saccharoperbutylacetonicum]AGF55708.1 hypothetical protein Cspa_c19420 [Clostridium saccharoperbutylacetonicum N1-4(HMT)]NRT63563.1 putative repeat protein (TIGR01451 family) [Clostridium saccharoperbutylacetonicum]NSB26926.1 putative repeat protein (TIGR01451 family) [Clostridium saccharoperbutylacetonicum]NSB40410.1 putative repeat protein (TIGR01451 family) [Clostridium saccharoperbutylacetonicum]